MEMKYTIAMLIILMGCQTEYEKLKESISLEENLCLTRGHIDSDGVFPETDDHIDRSIVDYKDSSIIIQKRIKQYKVNCLRCKKESFVCDTQLVKTETVFPPVSSEQSNLKKAIEQERESVEVREMRFRERWNY
jgi:hypothetical protein